MFRLAHKQVPAGPPIAQTVSPALQTVLDSLGTSPAWVMERRWNILPGIGQPVESSAISGC